MYVKYVSIYIEATQIFPFCIIQRKPKGFKKAIIYLYTYIRLCETKITCGNNNNNNNQVTGWDGELGESDSLKEQVGMDSLQAVEFRRIICTQVRLSDKREKSEKRARKGTYIHM